MTAFTPIITPQEDPRTVVINYNSDSATTTYFDDITTLYTINYPAGCSLSQCITHNGPCHGLSTSVPNEISMVNSGNYDLSAVHDTVIGYKMKFCYECTVGCDKFS